MDTILTDEQRMLRSMAESLTAGITPGGQTTEESIWSQLADAGLIGLSIPDVDGGSGGSLTDTVLVTEVLAAASTPLDQLWSGVIAPALLHEAGAGDILHEVCSGARRVAVALDRGLTALGRVDDENAIVINPGLAREALALDEAGRLVICAVAPRDDSADDQLISSGLGNATEPPIGTPLDDSRLRSWEAISLTAIAADAVGAAAAALALAVDYAANRVQFGAPIGSFQAIAHICADDHVSVEASRALAWYAAWAVASDNDQSLQSARTAKIHATQTGRSVCEDAIQVHGGIGMTWECPAHTHLRRMLINSRCLGGNDLLLDRTADNRLALVDS
ncbi:MAG: acyl-CoA dehydrogenase family protein [Ilumatobacteraceae bacterium]|nr:acyl-CoA dehydrogenase family protein [Ilumatobacteraceae bacterium]